MPVLDPRQEFNFAALAISGHTAGATVKVIRIDDLKLTRCNLIKVDVEGMEVDVLAGAAATIERFRPVLFVENNTIERSRPLLEMLQSLNYVAWWHIRNYFNPANFRWKLQSKNSPPTTAISLGILVRFRRSVCIGRGQTNSSRRVENGGGSGNQTESSDPAEGSLTSAGVGRFCWYFSAGYSRARKKLRFMSRPIRVCSNNWYRNQGAKRFVERRCSGIFSKIHYVHPRFVP